VVAPSRAAYAGRRRIIVRDNTSTVHAIYDAFGRGDLPAILAHVAPDVQWEYAYGAGGEMPVPWLAPGRGRDHVARFFGVLAEGVQFNRFEVTQILSGDGVVVALVSLDVTVRATGKHIVETDEPQVWHFDDAGQVCRFRHAADTYQQFRALQPV
jgi:uncharacterized protein